MYALQNDTGITVNTELYVSYFCWAGGGYTKGPPPECGDKTVTEVITVTESEVWDILI